MRINECGAYGDWWQSSFLEKLSVKNLLEVKKLALRRKTWFRSLSRIERAIIDLTVRYVENIKSTKLT